MRPLREPRSATEALRCGWLYLTFRPNVTEDWTVRVLECTLPERLPWTFVQTTTDFCRLCPEWRAREAGDE